MYLKAQTKTREYLYIYIILYIVLGYHLLRARAYCFVLELRPLVKSHIQDNIIILYTKIIVIFM